MKLVGRGMVAVVLALTMMLAGCSTEWIGQAQEIVAALIPAAANVVALVAALQGKGVSAQDLATIQSAGSQAGSDLSLIQSLITAYEQADSTAKPGIMNQIQTALATVQSNLQNLLLALHIKDTATQTKITAVVGILISEVQSLAAVIPVITGQSLVVGQALEKPPLSAREFVASFNATMGAKTGNAALDEAAAGLKIHQHSKAVRVVTVGVLK